MENQHAQRQQNCRRACAHFPRTPFRARQANHPSVQPGAAEPFLIILVPKIFRLKVFLPCPAQPSHSIALKRNPGPLKQNFKPHFSYEPGEQIAREPSGHTLSMRDENCSGCLWLAFASVTRLSSFRLWAQIGHIFCDHLGLPPQRAGSVQNIAHTHCHPYTSGKRCAAGVAISLKSGI